MVVVCSGASSHITFRRLFSLEGVELGWGMGVRWGVGGNDFDYCTGIMMMMNDDDDLFVLLVHVLQVLIL